MRRACKPEHIEVIKREDISRREVKLTKRCWVCGDVQEEIVNRTWPGPKVGDTLKIRKPYIWTAGACEHVWRFYSHVLHHSANNKPHAVYRCELCGEHEMRRR